MKEVEVKDNINNDKRDVEIFQHHKIESSSTSPLDSIQQNPNNNQGEKESYTVTTSLNFLNTNYGKNDPLKNLNNSSQQTDDTSNSININKVKDENKNKSETFYQKTKRWAGTVWSYIDIRNYFPKTEYLEYRNANGDMVKVPKKKLPLKKNNKQKIKEEEYIINKKIENETNEANIFAAGTVPMANYFM